MPENKISNQKFCNQLIVFARYVCSVCCDLFFSSAFIFTKYTQYTNSNATGWLYLAFIIPTFVNYVAKIVLSFHEFHFNVNEVVISTLSLSCGMLIISILCFEDILFKKYIFVGILYFCIFNMANMALAYAHDNFLTIPVNYNFNSLKSRLRKIFMEEVPNYGFAYYLSIFKGKDYKPYLSLSSIMFLVDAIFISMYSFFWVDSTSKVEKNLKNEEKNKEPKNVLILLFLLKVFGEVNDTLLYFNLASKLKEHGHLIHLFSVQFLLKLGYKKVDPSKLKSFALIKLLLYIASILVVVNVNLLGKVILSLIVFCINGVTNQMAFATYDYFINSNLVINTAEFSVFCMINFYLLCFHVPLTNDSLTDVIFMSNVRL